MCVCSYCVCREDPRRFRGQKIKFPGSCKLFSAMMVSVEVFSTDVLGVV